MQNVSLKSSFKDKGGHIVVYISKFYEHNFKASNSKDAFLKACKFVASAVISKSSKVEADRVTWDVKRVDSDDRDSLPTFRLTLYYKFDDTEFMKQTCAACKEFHCSFFINENYNCNSCNKVGYEKNVKEKLTIGSEYMKKMLDNELNKL